MSWTDRGAINHILKIRDIFKVKTFVETGTFKGMNVLAHKDNFNVILSCEKMKEYYNISINKCKYIKNINIVNCDSKTFLKWFREKHNQLMKITHRKENVIFYLDAHFFVKDTKTNEERFVVLQELKALKGMKNAIIIIHDFDNGLGHITYDKISLDMNLLRKDLLKVNPNFHFYTNELSSCDIITLEEEGKIPESKVDMDRVDNLRYAWSKPDKTYRGILYCVPKKINIEGLKEVK